MQSQLQIKLDCKGLSEEEVREKVASLLHFPDYYGHNWQAWHECLTDLDWIEQNSIEIELHNLKPQEEGESILMFMLLHVLTFWKDETELQTPHKNMKIILA